MKTLVVLSALAAIAVAAPALQGEGDNTDRVQDWHIQAHSNFPDTSKREKKSPSELATTTVLHTSVPHSEVHTDAGASAPKVRSSSSKKPLIVKKKFGYSLYRDSEEEKAHADPHESCGRQVKVKLCDEDGTFREMLRKSGHEFDDHASEDEMKHSIKMAKEAVESLQRDLKKMEHKNGAMKMAHDSESDTDLHKDIEVARQALKHIHENFENLETMSVHATASSDSENMHDVHFTIARSEEEKMAQWKEAMYNIDKNVEIAKNIENSFKTAIHEESLKHVDQTESASTNDEQKLEEHVASHAGEADKMRSVENLPQSTENENGEHHLLKKDIIEHAPEHQAREEQHTKEDMNSAASEVVEMKTVDIDNHHTLRSENHQQHEHEKSFEEKLEDHKDVADKNIQHIEKIQEHHQIAKNSETEINVAPSKDNFKHHEFKDVEEQKDINLDTDKHVLFKNSENTDTLPTPDSVTAPTLRHLTKEQRSSEIKEFDDKSNPHSMHETQREGINHLIDLHEKAMQHNDEGQKGKILENTGLNTETGKAAEKLKPELEEHHHKIIETKPKDASSHKETEENKKDTLPKVVHEIQLHKLNHFTEQNDNIMKAAQHTLDDQSNIDYNDTEPVALAGTLVGDNDFKLAPLSSIDEHTHHVSNIPAHWAHENRHLHSMKAVEESMKNFHEIDHSRNSHMAEHHLHPTRMGTHDFELSEHAHPHAHAPSRHHHNLMPHSQMHDTNFHSSMRDAMEGLGSEHMFRWKPSHDFSRNAYGTGISSSIGSSGGAVGVFPNANTGGCGIPLLLSCSPSVVSGSLAKAHATGSAQYAGPSYRTEEDFNFHKKRDVMKTNEMRSKNTLRTHVKTGTILENKM